MTLQKDEAAPAAAVATATPSASATVEAAAFVAPAAVPTDPLFGLQWHLLNSDYLGVDLNVVDLWEEFGGRGVLVGVIDDGVDYTHLDLVGNYDTTRDFDARDRDDDAFTSDPGDRHGTAVSGVIAAGQDNGTGGSGVAPEADLVGIRTGFGSNSSSVQITAAFQAAVNVDVANNSWSFGGFFFDDLSDETLYLWPTGEIGSLADAGRALETAVTEGRDGLGTVFVFSAGNGRGDGQDVNYHGFQNAPDTIAVAAIERSGAIASFSTPGAAVLVAAPGVGIVTTDRPGSLGYVGGDAVSIGGTSFSAPAVSGVIALMLEANPDLGYRDVQEILAYAARNPVASTAGWQTNGAAGWNGGGLTVSHDYGFGLVNAHAAVRLAEVWTQQSTKANLLTVEAASTPGLAVLDNSTVSDSLTVAGAGILIDQVTVTLDLTHSFIGDLIVTLESPDGTRSVLVNRPGATAANPDGTSQDNIQFTLNSVQFWGERGEGDWTLSVTDSATGDSGVLNGWTLTLLGDPASEDSNYIYTEEITRHAGEAGRQSLSDGAGVDTLNAAAVTSDSTIDLTPEATSTIHGVPITLAEGTVIENAIGGDGADRITGNEADNTLQGQRGDDTLEGRVGEDTLLGGPGADHLDGGADADRLEGGAGDDSLAGEGAADALYGDGGADRLNAGGGNDHLEGGSEGDTLIGDSGDDTLLGGAGDDALYGGRGADALDGGGGNDYLKGGSDNDTLAGGADDDTLKGGSGDDHLDGGDGADYLAGSTGVDRMTGGAGDDRFVLSKLKPGEVDTITDYSRTAGDSDTIDLDLLPFDFTATGGSVSDPLAEGYVGFAAGGAGDTVLQVDFDGGGDGLMDAATLTGVGAGDEVRIGLDGGLFTVTVPSAAASSVFLIAPPVTGGGEGGAGPSVPLPVETEADDPLAAALGPGDGEAAVKGEPGPDAGAALTFDALLEVTAAGDAPSDRGEPLAAVTPAVPVEPIPVGIEPVSTGLDEANPEVAVAA